MVVAVGNANTDIADYLREMLPDKHLEQQHSCKKRWGFERAGRWMRLGRASGYLQDLVSSWYVVVYNTNHRSVWPREEENALFLG